MQTNNLQIFALTNYIMSNHLGKKEDPFLIFNLCVDKFNIQVSNYKEALWLIDYIRNLAITDDNLIYEALEIDKNKYKEGNKNG